MLKKQKDCDPLDEDDMLAGDQWDFVALDPDSRLILSVFVGKRLADNASAVPTACFPPTTHSHLSDANPAQLFLGAARSFAPASARPPG